MQVSGAFVILAARSACQRNSSIAGIKGDETLCIISGAVPTFGYNFSKLF